MAPEFSVAPMVGVSTPQFRRLMEIVTPGSFVFTEMIVDTTLIHMRDEALEQKLGLPGKKTILQIGGTDPEKVSLAVQRAMGLGYSEFNLNCGCPSTRVQHGQFGAVLMKDPAHIAKIITRVYEYTGAILSVKCRTGVDDVTDYASFRAMIDTITGNSPCTKFYIHARTCLLKGLSPAENRKVPPLAYDHVYRLKEERPHLTVIINGGVADHDALEKHLKRTDGVMLGRKPRDDPMFFAGVERRFIGGTEKSADSVVSEYLTSIKEARKSPAADLGWMGSDHMSPMPAPVDFADAGIEPTACRYSDLKPIEPLLFGKRRCKEYKKKLADLARKKLPPEAVWGEISEFFRD